MKYCLRYVAPGEFQEWWPAGLQSPSFYYHVRARQLAYQYSTAPECTWREPDSPGVQSSLRSQRHLRQLSVRLPSARTNIYQGETLVYLGEVLVCIRRLPRWVSPLSLEQALLGQPQLRQHYLQHPQQLLAKEKSMTRPAFPTPAVVLGHNLAHVLRSPPSRASSTGIDSASASSSSSSTNSSACCCLPPQGLKNTHQGSWQPGHMLVMV
ncbi:hypothetical protein N2152v2_007714 [Parachlorella kessleri]